MKNIKYIVCTMTVSDVLSTIGMLIIYIVYMYFSPFILIFYHLLYFKVIHSGSLAQLH